MNRKIKIFILIILSIILLVGCTNENNIPYIGENGNWWIGETDLGVQAKGEKGDKGDKGDQGEKGNTGDKGDQGETGISIVSMTRKSSQGLVDTYEIKYSNGTTSEILITNGKNGLDGKSAYELAKSNGFNGTEEEWIKSLKGETGSTPYIGENNNWWIDGVDTGLGAVEQNMSNTGTDGLIFTLTIRNGIAGYEVTGYYNSNYDDSQKKGTIEMVVPNEIFNKPVISIKDDCLPKGIKKLTLGSNMIYLGSMQDTYIEEIDFNHSKISKINDETFVDCNYLVKLSNYENVKELGNDAFCNTAIYDFDFSNIEIIGSGVFANRETVYKQESYYDYEYGTCTRNVFDHYAYSSSSFNYENRVANGLEGIIYIPKNVKNIGANAFFSKKVFYANGEFIDEVVPTEDDPSTTQVRSTGVGSYNVIQGKDYYYRIKDNKAILIDYRGSDSIITLPSTIDNISVYGIKGFNDDDQLIKVIANENITYVESCFYNCDNLDIVYFKGTLTNHGSIYSKTVFLNQVSLVVGTTEYNENSDYRAFSKREHFNVKLEDIYEDENCIYINKNNELNIVYFKNSNKEINISSNVNNIPITKILRYALYNNEKTEILRIPSTIVQINKNSIISENLKGLVLDKNIETIKKGALDVKNATIVVTGNSVPDDWDSSYADNSKIVYLNNKDYRENDDYIYLVTNSDSIVLIKYKYEKVCYIEVPDKIDDLPVNDIQANCYNIKTNKKRDDENYYYCYVYIPQYIENIADNAFYITNSSTYNIFNLYTNYNPNENAKSWMNNNSIIYNGNQGINKSNYTTHIMYCGIVYNIENNKLIAISLIKEYSDNIYIIPESINGYEVSKINNGIVSTYYGNFYASFIISEKVDIDFNFIGTGNNSNKANVHIYTDRTSAISLYEGNYYGSKVITYTWHLKDTWKIINGVPQSIN